MHKNRDEPEELERRLTHPDHMVRLKAAYRLDMELSPAQIERGLTDAVADVRCAFIIRIIRERGRLTPTQVERGLTDESAAIRYRTARWLATQLTESQIKRGRADSDPRVRKMFDWMHPQLQRTA